MSSERATLRHVATSVLERLRDAIAAGQLPSPVDRASLVGFGIKHQVDAIERALVGHKSAACLAVLDVVLAEREERKPAPELVWTGPEGPGSKARDTAVVLRDLFESARETVVLAGYNFDHAHEVLAPLHASMLQHGVEASFFVHVPQVERAIDDPRRYLRDQLGGFLAANWPFGSPYPRIYVDKRALEPGPPFCSLHAKCVVVDGRRAFVSSANFTQRGQERNIEVGVLIEDASFASYLAGQWLGLVDAGNAEEFRE